MQRQHVVWTRGFIRNRMSHWGFFIALSIVTLSISGYANLAMASEEITWEAANAKGMQAYRQRNFTKAKEWFSEALLQSGSGGMSDPQQAMTLNNLAAIHAKLGEYDEADLRYRQSLTIIESIQGPQHPDLLPGLKNLALLHRRQEDFAQAERLYQRSFLIVKRLLGEDHPHLIPGLLDLAQTSQAQQEYGRAEDYYREALTIAEAKLEPAHHQTQSIRMQYAALLKHLNRLDEANALEEQATRALSSPSSPNH